MMMDVFGVGIPHVGYGRMADSLRDALSKKVTISADAGAILFCVPPDMVKGWYEGQRTACLTMWETTLVPPRYTRLLRMFDRVIVPCPWNAELFAPYHHDIKVIPLGIDVDLWQPQDVVVNDRFRFITGGSGWKRKGIGQVIQAFRDANLPDSELLIKVTPDLLDDPKQYDFGPNIHVVKKRMSLTEERDFYATADCFVSATRGEGFGMIPLQNLALGNRVIAPNHTGHEWFADLFDYSVGWHYSKAEMQYFSDIGDWFEPNHDELVDAMKAVYAAGRLPAWERLNRWEQVEERFTWDRAADALLRVFPGKPALKVKRWEDSGKQTVKVRTLRKVEADVGVFHFKFPANTEVDVPISTLAHLVECGLVTEL